MSIAKTIAKSGWKKIAILTIINIFSILFVDAQAIHRRNRRRTRSVRSCRTVRRQHRRAAVVAPGGKFATTLAHFFTEKEIADQVFQNRKQEVVWAQEVTDPFRELIISWNALRPTQGYITILGRIKCIGKWTDWQLLAKWSGDSQRTFGNKTNALARAKCSRFETMRGYEGRGFQVKAVFHDGAKPASLKALFGCISRPQLLRIASNKSELPSVLVKDVPQQSQRLLPRDPARVCSPTSVSMLVAYFYQKLYGQRIAGSLTEFAASMAQRVYDHGAGIYGNWILNVAQAYDALGGLVYFCAERMNGFTDLYSCLSQKVPIVVSVRRLPGGATSYAGGHLLAVVGWNKKRQSVLCVDPAFANNRATLRAYPLRAFLQAWARSSNLAYRPILSAT